MNTNTDNTNDFKDLETLLDQIEHRGLGSLGGDNLLYFGRLYRRAVSALSTARSQGVDDVYIEYLNRLVARAYGHIYVTEKRGWPSVKDFFLKEFPQSIRRNLLFILISFLISFGAALFAFGIVSRDQGKIDVLMGQQWSQAVDEIAERHTGDKDWLPSSVRPIASSMIMTNNIKVAAVAFATGVLLGIGTFGILFYNGLMLGVIAAAIRTRGPNVAMGFWSFVAPHGVIELTAIFIAGGAGLMLGWALLNPGEYTRRDALKLAGREALKLMLGVAAMLVVAGIIEGFLSPAQLPNTLKLSVAAILGIAQFSYFFLAGRESAMGGRSSR